MALQGNAIPHIVSGLSRRKISGTQRDSVAEMTIILLDLQADFNAVR